ncbi:MAG: Rieske (2Fe-2S) protein [Thermoanaerobaculia bacterium]
MPRSSILGHRRPGAAHLRLESRTCPANRAEIETDLTWIRAGSAAELGSGELKVLRLMGRAVGVRRAATGEIQAFELACRHQGADLSGGVRDGAIVTCPRHGWRYDLETGACLTAPDLPLRRLDIEQREDRLFVHLESRLDAEPDR